MSFDTPTPLSRFFVDQYCPGQGDMHLPTQVLWLRHILPKRQLIGLP
jgi:hypothetical protein